MNYITIEKRGKLDDKPYEISIDDLEKMRRLNRLDFIETKGVTESSYRNETFFPNADVFGNNKFEVRRSIYNELLYRDMKTDGFIAKYSHGNVITQGQSNSFYRGENKRFPQCVASIFRGHELEDEEELKKHLFISKLRIEEFTRFLCRFEIVKYWMNNYGSVLFDPLAQHYGLATEWLDITSDLEIALFFATCKWSKDERGWKPISKEDIQTEDEQYGVIFHVPECQANIRTNMDQLNNNRILPIGYQPFMRCHSQHAYGICMRKPTPLQDDIMFEKLYFKHDEDFSREIFENMDQGRKVFPREGINGFEDVIDTIKELKVFSKEAYYNVLEREEYYSSDAEARKALKGVDILDESPIPTNQIKETNQKYSGFSIEKEYGIKLLSREIYYPC